VWARNKHSHVTARAKPMFAGFLVLVALGLSSCAAGKQTAVGGNCPTGVPGVTAQSIDLGYLTPSAGAAAAILLPVRAGIDARIGLANAQGGVNGRTISYKWENDDSTDEGAAASARRLIRTDQVFGLLGGSANLGGAAEFLASQNVPVVGQATDGSWRLHPNMVTVSNQVEGQPVSTFGDLVNSHGGHRAAVLSVALIGASNVISDVLRAGLTDGGVPVAEQVKIPLSGARYSETAARLKSEDVDTLVSAVDPGALAGVVSALAALGEHPLVISLVGYGGATPRNFGSRLAGSYFLTVARPFESPTAATTQYLNAMAAYAPYLQQPRDQFALEGWISADLFIQGLKLAGPCPTRASVLKRLHALRGYDAGQLLPRPLDLATASASIEPCYFVTRVSADGTSFVPDQPLTRCGQSFAS